MATVSAVNSGISKLTRTWLWAPRLYTSSGRMRNRCPMRDELSVRSA